MKKQPARSVAQALAAFLLFSVALAAPRFVAASATQREHLTPEEVEMVRDNQELDKRTEVFVKAVERRLAVITGAPQAQTPTKREQKEADKWGAIPKGTRAQLLGDVARILGEAVTNIEDAAIHEEKSPLIPKSLRILGEACKRFLPQLAALRSSVNEDAEREPLEKAVENAQEIIEAADKLPAEVKKK
jgi:hypothetical protein